VTGYEMMRSMRRRDEQLYMLPVYAMYVYAIYTYATYVCIYNTGWFRDIETGT
jgi:hypothetical protein